MLTKFQAHTYSFRDWILGDRYSPQTNIRLTDWYMRMPDVMIVAICMKHRPEQQREITSFFFDAWIPLLSLVHRKFSWAAGPVIDLLNGFILHYLSGRLRVMDEVQGSNKKHICIHPIKCFTKKRHLFCCFEQGPAWSFPHMVLINSRGPQYYSFDTACWKYPNTNSHCTANRLSCRHNHFHRWPMRYLTEWKSFNKKKKLYQWHQYKQLWGLSAVGPLLSTYRCSG